MKLGALFSAVSVALLLLVSPSFAQSDSPWVSNRAIGEGQGYRSGSIEWHPALAGSFGYDSNYLQLASSPVDDANYGPVIPSLRFTITPKLSIRSAHLRDLQSNSGEGGLPPALMYDLSLIGSYNEFVPLKEDSSEVFQQLRNIEGGGDLTLDILRGRPWFGRGFASYVYYAEPSNQGGGGESYDRHVLGLSGAVNWSPGGGRFNWKLLEYVTGLTLFDQGNVGAYNNITHSLVSAGNWRFLPKTGILYDANLTAIQYASDVKNPGEILQARLGLNGLVTQRLGLLAMGGWAASFFQDRNGVARNFSSFVTQLEARWYLSAHGKLKEGDVNVGASSLAVGYLRDFSASYIGDFYRRNRLYAKMNYLIASRMVTTMEAGVAVLSYPDYYMSTGEAGPGFSETRIDLSAFSEYRLTPTIGINLRLTYDMNASEVINYGSYEDDLSFKRFRAILGARWFL
jgi:hypothetical protein